MQHSKFWQIVAVVAVAALLYIGLGLNNGPDGRLGLVNSARANGITLANNQTTILTTSADGRIVYVWPQNGANDVTFVKAVLGH